MFLGEQFKVADPALNQLLVRAVWHDQSREAAANLTSTATGRAPAARDWLASSAMRYSIGDDRLAGRSLRGQR
jgi:hypothetical protein